MTFSKFRVCIQNIDIVSLNNESVSLNNEILSQNNDLISQNLFPVVTDLGVHRNGINQKNLVLNLQERESLVLQPFIWRSTEYCASYHLTLRKMLWALKPKCLLMIYYGDSGFEWWYLTFFFLVNLIFLSNLLLCTPVR